MIFSQQESEVLFGFIFMLTGANYKDQSRRHMIENKIKQRMKEINIGSLEKYLTCVESQRSEYDRLISMSTIHTTGFFREAKHFEALDRMARAFKIEKGRKFRVWCSACSTGQEVYTVGFILERVRIEMPSFDYEILGSDIDVISLNFGRKAIYEEKRLKEIPDEHDEFVMEGSGKSEGFFTIDSEIRQRTQFKRVDLNNIKDVEQKNFDVIFCRNVLIYFDKIKVTNIVSKLLTHLKTDGYLILGHSEYITPDKFRVVGKGGSIYWKHFKQKVAIPKKHHILVVDDSPTFASFMNEKLSEFGFEVTVATSGRDADVKMSFYSFDLITLDLHMPETSGGEWISEVRKRGNLTPVLIVSEANPSEAFKIIEVLERESVEFLEKVKVSQNPKILNETIHHLIDAPEGEKAVRPSSPTRKRISEVQSPDVILIGASTGGPKALTNLLKDWPQPSPPVVIVQHISENFLWAFAKRLAQVSKLNLSDPNFKGPLRKNHLYMALSDYHIQITNTNGDMGIRSFNGPPHFGHRPAVNELFTSAVPFAQRVCSIILTGMGQDGAKGMLELRNGGALTFGQDEVSCTVYGMPREAYNIGGVEFVGDVQFIRSSLLQILKIDNSKENKIKSI